MKSLKIMSDEWLGATCWSSLLLEICMIKCVVFSVIVLGVLKQDCEIKTSEILSSPLLENNFVTIGLHFFNRFLICYYIIKHYLYFSFPCWVIFF